MNDNMSSVDRVRHALRQLQIDTTVRELPESTRTAVDAARAVQCDVKQIAKSLIFKTSEDNQAVLIITSGANRVNEEKVGKLMGQEIETANADFVRRETGFAIGGVAPVGLPGGIPTYIDEELLTCEEIWAAAGSPFTVFKLTPEELQQATRGEVIAVK